LQPHEGVLKLIHVFVGNANVVIRGSLIKIDSHGLVEAVQGLLYSTGFFKADAQVDINVR